MPTLTHFPPPARLLIGALLLLIGSLNCSPSFAASSASEAITEGTLMMRNDLGEAQELPQVSTDVSIDITGPIARTVVIQEFHNPDEQWVEALYLFPLPTDAAVDRMRMEVGDRVIEGQIKEREEAKATYEQAKSEGKRAALVEQDRPNLFSTSVANIPPRGRIVIRIEYQQSLAWRDGEFSLRFPMAITPRYRGNLPEPEYEPEYVIDSSTALGGGWSLLPGERPSVIPLTELTGEKPVEHPVTLHATLRAGFDLAEVKSHYHQVKQTESEQGAVEIELDDPNRPANRDFLLTWKPVPAQAPKAALFSETTERGRYALLMLTPPGIEGWQLPNREVIFVIDTSGSMGGQSIRAAREALHAGLGGLKLGDSFNIIEFNNESHQLFGQAQPLNERTLSRANRFIDNLEADGGTNMFPALDSALITGADNRRLRQIIFITDGAVSREQELFQHIHKHLGYSRLFTVGIGSAPNSYFMEEAAVTGRGTFTYIASPDEAEETMKALFTKLSKPALTDIQIEGEGVGEIAPSIMPDLYAGEPLNVAMELSPGVNKVLLKGRIGNALWQQNIDIESNDIQPGDRQTGISIDWARKRITQWQRAGTRGVEQSKIKQAITELALDFHLVSPYTSLVAVDVTPVRPETEGLDTRAVPAQKPQGLEVKKLLPMAQGATGYEATLLIGAGLLLLSLLLMRLQKRRGDQWGAAS